MSLRWIGESVKRVYAIDFTIRIDTEPNQGGQDMNRIAMTVAAGLFVATGAAGAQAGEIFTVKSDAAFEDVRQDVSDAIINRGYVIDYSAKIGEMLDRTRSDVGSTKRVYANAETVQFCSAVLSRKAMEADPANIAFCPYVVFFYETADEPGVVHVGFRKLPEDGSAESKEAKGVINRLLTEIVEEAAGQ